MKSWEVILLSKNKIKITVYGAEQVCPSCVGAPDSLETYEWLQAAITRKYNNPNIVYEYVDIFEEQEEKLHQNFIEEIFNEDLFYPIIFVNEDLVAEGIPRIKPIYEKIEEVMK